ncbi:MAG: Rrf2 family transcriptional regulator [Pelagimonas sp.]|jgi:Rrf2 family nitric oxide-sensitive transcriptional repressor|nr:Rrf2 family transcriptional regulator [Pelagimonas sp.]
MKLSRYSDYALRVCLYLAAQPDRLVSISEIVGSYDLPKGNIMKLSTDLVRAGILRSVRGRSGGLQLAQSPAEITVGEILRYTEGNQPMVDCSGCPLAAGCGLICILREAQAGFFKVLDTYSLQDVHDASPDLLKAVLTENRGQGGTESS